MGGLLIGAEAMSASLLMLMVINLFDVFSAATVDPVNSTQPVPETQLSTQDQFWMTSRRTNAFNDSEQAGSVMFSLFMQIFLLATAGGSGYVPPVLLGAFGTQLLCGVYSFLQP